MNSHVKRTIRTFALFIVMAFIAAALQLPFAIKAKADEPANEGATYYYEELKKSELAQKFYRIFKANADKGEYLSGNYEYDLANDLSQSEIAAYVEGNSPLIPVAFSAARDAFYMDNPDLFYLDAYKLYLSAGTDGSGKYVAYVGTGSADNYFAENTVTAANVNKAVEDYEKALNDMVALANQKQTDAERIKVVNAELCKVQYDYEAREDLISGKTVLDGFVHTAYGALVNKIALCGGFSRGFKAVMDRLGIPCVIIQGTYYSSKAPEGREAGYQAHAWNAVKLDGLWYGVDVTMNSGAVNKETYLLVGDEFLSKNHFPDGVISSSGFELKYPVLRAFDYGVNEDKNGFGILDSGKVGDQELGYSTVVTDFATTRYLTLGVGYCGLDAVQLKEQGKYLAYHALTDPNGDWGAWIGIDALAESSNHKSENGYTPVQISSGVSRVQFGIIDHAPDMQDPYLGEVMLYDPEKLTDANILTTSIIYGNDCYGDFSRAPYVSKCSPDQKGYISSFDALDVELTYNEKLVKPDGSDIDSDYKIELKVLGSAGDDLTDITTVENLKWNSATNTLSFRFTPDISYSRNCETYSFLFANAKGDRYGKTPEPGGYLSFKRKQVICPKVFNDGRLYMQVYGQPQFVGAEDLTLDDKFVDGNGKPIIKQRSQMLLVVNEPGASQTEKLENALEKEVSGIQASATYQIDLQMCGVVQKVPDGSYMQVGFGFPAGYAPSDNKNVTYTAYHYTLNDDGTIKSIDPIPCVITEYGLVATVKSFSPFTICAVEKSSVAGSDKNIYASVTGEGGSIDKTAVLTVSEGGSVEYTLTASEGYEFDRALLNGKDEVAVSGGKIVLSYDELDSSNVLEISFISSRVREYRTENGLKIASPRYVVTSSDMIEAVAHIDSKGAQKKNHTVAIVVTVIVVLVAVAAAVCIALFVIQKEKNDKGGNGGSGSKNKKQTQKSSAAQSKPAAATAGASAGNRASATRTNATTAAPNRTTDTAARANSTTRPNATAANRTSAASRPASSSARPNSTAANRTAPTRPSSAVNSTRSGVSSHGSTPRKPNSGK